METKRRITKFELDVAKWYQDIIYQSELTMSAPIKGTMYFKPYGYAIWKRIMNLFNEEFDKLGVQEVKFPLLFPYSMFKKEQETVDGFTPELLLVDKIGNKSLTDPYVVRPTSEILFCDYFKKNIKNYNDLPIKLNQWVNVFRLEKNTKPFLRNVEFFWQEGHTLHETDIEAHNFTLTMIDVYEKVAQKNLLLPVFKGEKTIVERFAGAKRTFTIESILKDGQSLQVGTSHYLEQTFVNAFDITFQDRNNKISKPFQTSWGVSTRLMGAIIMTHSDNSGLRLPSTISPIQIVITTLFISDEKLILKLEKILAKLSKMFTNKIRFLIDDSEKGIGFKAQQWEVKGIPIRIEIGKNELENNQLTIVNRSLNYREEVLIKKVNIDYFTNLLIEYDNNLFSQAIEERDKKIGFIYKVSEITNVVENGRVAWSYWNENSNLETEIKKMCGATIRLISNSDKVGKCIWSKEETKKIALWARAY